MEPKFVPLRSYPAAIHAELAKSALQASGIAAFVRGGTLNDQRWEPGVAIEIWVPEGDVDRANEILGTKEHFSD
jgi:hypothetical protein